MDFYGYDITTCSKCGTKVAFRLVGTVYPGGKDREVVYCPKCGEELHSEMTSQTFEVKEVYPQDKKNL